MIVDVKIDGNKIGNVKMVGEPVVLGKRETTKLILPLDINTDSKDIINMVIYYLKNKKSKQYYRIRWYYNGSGINDYKRITFI